MAIIITKSISRQFGWLLSFCCLVGAAFLFYYDGPYFNHLGAAGFIFLTLSWLKPEIFFIPAKGWLLFGLVLSKVTNPILMGLIYFMILCPLSLLLWIFRKDLLMLSRDAKKQSYWNMIEGDDETKLERY